MSKLVAGFLLGVTSTLVVVYWFDDERQEEHVQQIVETSQVDGATEPEQADQKGPNSVAAEGRADETGPVIAQPGFSAAARSNARPEPPAGRASPDRSAADYPPEIAEMIENRVDKELQSRYENDAREESWAAYMEALLADYFAQKPALAQFYFSLIDCRTSVCSVHVLGYGPDALTLWNTATADIVSQQWFEFNNMSLNRRNPEPDVLAIVLILTKKPPE